MRIPFNKPYIATDEVELAMDSLRSRISGDGYYTKKATEFMERTFRTKKALITTSCTAALEMAAILLNLSPGDEVIMPSYTFVSTANAVVLRGAKPVFADIKEDTLNIDPVDIKRKITGNTKAIFVVHYAGVSCDMDTIMETAGGHSLKVVEDAAQAVNSKYKDRYLGTIGDIGCYSFHESKNYTCGEGGAILINGNEDMKVRAEYIREKGTDRSRFLRGDIDKYTWIDIGSSYLPSDILSAILYAQLTKLNEISERREKIYNYYYNALEPLSKNGVLRVPTIPEGCVSNYHMFYIILNSEDERNNLIDRLRQKGIGVVFHYMPLHTSPMGRNLGNRHGDLPITEKVSTRLLRLPIYPELGEKELKYIIDNIYNILCGRNSIN